MPVEHTLERSRPITIPNGESNADQPINPPFDYLTNFAFYSFEHGQGRASTQRLIYQNTRAIRPAWNITAKMFADLPGAIQTRIVGHLNHSDPEYDNNPETFAGKVVVHEYVEPDKRIQEMLNRLGDFQEAFATPAKSSKDVLQSLTLQLFLTEFEYLYQRKNGRPRHGIKTSSLKSDPWFSYLCYYALLGNSTGITEFDEMYAGIKKGIYQHGYLLDLNRETDAAVTAVVDIWNEKHLDQKVIW